MSIEYRYEKFERDSDVPFAFTELEDHRLPMTLQLFHPSGLGATLRATWVKQEGEFQDFDIFAPTPFYDDERDFWVLDVGLRYRLPKRSGFVSVGVKEGATIPIISHHGGHDTEHVEAPAAADSSDHEIIADHPEKHGADIDGADAFANPLPHVLMLTAIVVGVATLGVGLSVAQKVFIQFQTLEEDKILERIRNSDG